MADLVFAFGSPVGRAARAIVDVTGRRDDVTIDLDEHDNGFVVFSTTSPTGRLLEALIDLVDERAEMREAAAS